MDSAKEYGPIPRFSGQPAEFPTWKFLVLAQLRARDMDHLVVDSTEKREQEMTDAGETATQKAEKEKKEVSDREKDKKAFALLSSALPTSTAANLLSCKTPRDIWVELSAIFEQQSKVSRTMLMQQFYRLEYMGEPMAEYLAKVEGLVSQLKSAGVELKEEEVVSKLLTTLPQEYASFQTAWDQKPEEDYTMVKFTAALTKQELRLSAGAEVLTKALTAQSREGAQQQKPGNGNKMAKPKRFVY